jgi:hypothetical protein
MADKITLSKETDQSTPKKVYQRRKRKCYQLEKKIKNIVFESSDSDQHQTTQSKELIDKITTESKLIVDQG